MAKRDDLIPLWNQMTTRKSSSIADRAWQRMLSGRRLDLLDPSPLDIEIADIAHGLARVARWNGQTSGAHIFSVAQHTLLVETVMREQMPRVDARFRIAALLHDAPEYDDRALYEKLILDGFQAGLSWITILRKRENFRKAFDDFQPEKIARYNEKKVHALMNDAGIVRNRAKIEGAVNSAKSYLKIMEEGAGFSKFLWDFVDGKPIVNQFKTTASVPASTPLSIKLSKELGARGFKFVGPTIVYAFMQATGMVNDHLVTCFCHENCSGKLRKPRLKTK